MVNDEKYTYAEALKKSLRVVEIVDGYERYPLAVPHFFESLFLVYAHIVRYKYSMGYPAYQIGGEKYPKTEEHYPTLDEVTGAIIGISNPMMSVDIGVEFNDFIDWLLKQVVPDDDETIMWGGPSEIINKFNEWVSLPKSPEPNS